jgi:hypothetical protein
MRCHWRLILFILFVVLSLSYFCVEHSAGQLLQTSGVRPKISVTRKSMRKMRPPTEVAFDQSQRREPLIGQEGVMSHWQPIATAPFDHPIEVSVYDRGEYHALAFLVRRTAAGWRGEIGLVAVSPTHWHDSAGCGLNHPNEAAN